jgi:plastocyanin
MREPPIEPGYRSRRMRARAAKVVLIALLVLPVAAAPAANQSVTATSALQFTPNTITIAPGDTVTWNNTGGVHNVHLDDGSFTQPASPTSAPWQVQHTFTTPGIYRYHCDLHGTAGGGGMAGVVKVTTAPLLKNASPMSVPLVPAHRQTISTTQCTARGGLNSSHGAPLAFSSCNPPAYVPGTQAKLGTHSTATAQLTVVEGNLVTAADEADVSIGLNASDVRAQSGGGDYAPNPSGPDTTLTEKLRLTDSLNGASLTDPATTTDFDFPVPADCAPTADPTVGSACSVSTSADAVTPGTIKEGRDMIMQVFRARLNDSGTNGTRADADDRVFAQQGIFVP